MQTTHLHELGMIDGKNNKTSVTIIGRLRTCRCPATEIQFGVQGGLAHIQRPQHSVGLESRSRAGSDGEHPGNHRSAVGVCFQAFGG